MNKKAILQEFREELRAAIRLKPTKLGEAGVLNYFTDWLSQKLDEVVEQILNQNFVLNSPKKLNEYLEKLKK